jgi:DHA2 family multidrug resistance protein-like MFS transporter
MNEMDNTSRAGRREWVGLAVLALPTLLVSIDVFVMLLALPAISEALHAGSTQQLWIMDTYGFALSGLMITMGTLGDRIGRRRLLLFGAGAFGLVSVAAAYAPSAVLLIGARALLGVAGATLAPCTLALISNMFRDPRQRGLAIGIWLACFMGGAAIGPLVGGALLDRFWWGSVFLLGVPAMVLLLVLGPRLLPEHRDPHPGRFDPASVALSMAAILPAVYGIKELARHGFNGGNTPPVALVLGIAMGVIFVQRQRRLRHPLLDLGLFRSRAFSTALGGMLLGTMLMGAMMLFITQHFQLVQGLSPLRAGLWMMPAVVASGVSFLVGPLLARRIAPARLIASGLLLSTVGLLLVARVDEQASPVELAVAFAVTNLGAGPLVTLAADLVVGEAPPAKAGSAAALNETSGELGFALGIALLGSLGTAVYRARVDDALPAGLPTAAADAAHDTIVGAAAAASTLPSTTADALLVAARTAYTDGMQVAALVSAVLLFGVALLVATQLRHVRPTGVAAPNDHQPASAPPA